MTIARVSARSAMVIVGTRPEAIKLAPVILALRDAGQDARVCLTGQHPELAMTALQGFGISADITLSVMRRGQSAGALGARAVAQLAEVVKCERPAWVVVQGDTASALAGALAGRAACIPVAHVEAGLRSFDPHQPFPEEINRTLIARLSALHFAPTGRARHNLLGEGVDDGAILVTGNTVVDALHWTLRRAAPTAAAHRKLIVATLHRRENRASAFPRIVAALARLAMRGDVDVLLPRHPGCAAETYAPLEPLPHVQLTAPMTYAVFAAALARAHLVITDSGGVQEEASALGVPTLIVRALTERPEVVEAGTAIVVDTETDPILAAATRLLDDADAHQHMARASTQIGDGQAGLRIAQRLCRELSPA